MKRFAAGLVVLICSALFSGCWLAYWPAAVAVYEKKCGQERDKAKDTPELEKWCRNAKEGWDVKDR